MEIIYYEGEDVMYIDLSPKKGKKRRYKETGGKWPVNIDFDKEDRVIGIEIISASKVVNIGYLKKLKFKKVMKKDDQKKRK